MVQQAPSGARCSELINSNPGMESRIVAIPDEQLDAAAKCSPPVVLIVDDSKKNLQALEAVLSRGEQQIVSATSGREALRYLLQHRVAVILLDVRMPDMDGFETAKLIRESDVHRTTPILFLTAYHKDDEHLLRGYDLGAVDYLFKPYVPHILQAKVRALVDLFNKTREVEERTRRLLEIERAKEREREREKERRIEELESTVQYLRTLARRTFDEIPFRQDKAPLKERDPAVYRTLVQNYRTSLEGFVDALVVEQPSPRGEMRHIAGGIHQMAGGSRDLLDAHVDALDGLLDASTPERTEALAFEGRLFALEMMAYLADAYRETVWTESQACKEIQT